jgi:hypothetical protein
MTLGHASSSTITLSDPERPGVWRGEDTEGEKPRGHAVTCDGALQRTRTRLARSAPERVERRRRPQAWFGAARRGSASGPGPRRYFRLSTGNEEGMTGRGWRSSQQAVLEGSRQKLRRDCLWSRPIDAVSYSA